MALTKVETEGMTSHRYLVGYPNSVIPNITMTEVRNSNDIATLAQATSGALINSTRWQF